MFIVLIYLALSNLMCVVHVDCWSKYRQRNLAHVCRVIWDPCRKEEGSVGVRFLFLKMTMNVFRRRVGNHFLKPEAK